MFLAKSDDCDAPQMPRRCQVKVYMHSQIYSSITQMCPIFSLFVIICMLTVLRIAKGVRDPHYILHTDKNAERYKNGLVKLPPTHKYLNAVRKWKKDPYVGRIAYSYGHLPYGYFGREEVDKLVAQRERHENKTEMYVKAGKLLYHDNKVVAGLIFDRAKKHRTKAQNVHEELEKERSKAHKYTSWKKR
ncbi:uncharacterized protein FA14DRAFT_75130 [Meira miltonrushii]|uniref:Uncharacterized protein n=1 Tax=Meira miltonrushii TaxID=1280837 RepID=A0A316V5N9_9BASI|nr:uncharacterized protein FA14DRAFT_75130 [Meira miltonrushii]PWN32544.1 hypothetical protein FA14DRAFT_75130 [Meira miltonrushii]